MGLPMKRRTLLYLALALVALAVLLTWLFLPAADSEPAFRARAASTSSDRDPSTRTRVAASSRAALPSLPTASAHSGLRSGLVDEAATDETRIVRGYVLDLRGDPVAHAKVRLWDMRVDLDRVTTSDAGGAFVFEGAPSSPLKVEASSTGSRDLAWVDSGTDEALVELVLEPTAIIRVIGRPGESGTAEVRCPSDACFGGGAPWQRNETLPLSVSQQLLNPDRATLIEIFADVPDEPIRLVPILIEGAGPFTLDPVEPPMMPPDAPTGDAGFAPHGDASPWTLVAAGALRSDLEVTADLSYDVFIVAGSERVGCGSVRPAPGAIVEVPCGPGEVQLSGRAIDSDGTPIVGLAMTLEVHDNSRTGLPEDLSVAFVTGAEGRFSLSLQVPGAMHGRIGAADLFGNVASIPLVPGARHDVGDIAFHAPDHGIERVREGLLDPFGPVGAVFGKSADGARVLAVEPGGPFELAGLARGDVLLRIEGRSTVDIDDLERMLAGPHGSPVNLRVRSADGALADVVVTRDTSAPDPSHIVEVERPSPGGD